MKYSIVVDSVACLPEQEIKQRGIKVLPLKVTFEDVKYIDTYEEKALLAIHKAGRVGIKSKALSITPTEDDIRDFVLKNVVLNCDLAICQTIAKEYTPIFQAYKSVSDSLAAQAKKVREEKGETIPFRMTSMDTGSLAAGQGLIALHSDNLLRSGVPYSEFKPVIEDFKTLVRSITIVQDPVYIRHRVKQKGNKTVSLPVALIAKALEFAPIANNQNGNIDIIDMKVRGFDKAVERVLEYCVDCVNDGLVAPLVNISFAGDPKALTKHNSYKRLQHACDDAGVTLYVGVMTLAASINLGPGTLSVALAPINQEVLP